MKIKVTFSFLIAIILNSYSQFSTLTEYNYLKLINHQKDKKLILSSVKNADIVSSKLILEKPSTINALFYNELSKSYYIIDEFELAFYYQIAQRTYFYNDSIARKVKNRFYDTGYKMRLEKSIIDFIWHETSKMKPSKKDKIEHVLELAIKLYAEPLTNKINELGAVLKKQNETMPQWYNDWQYLTNIKIKEKNKKKYLNFQSNEALFKRLSDKKKKKLYSKSINYYTKKHAFNHADELMFTYKEHLSFFGKSDLLLKKITRLYHKIF